MLLFEPITRRQILHSSKLKEFADDNFKFDENGRQLSKRVENTVGKGEIARSEQFLLFPQCFQKACFPGVSKGVIVWEWVKSNFSFSHSVFKRLVSQGCQKVSLCGNGLRVISKLYPLSVVLLYFMDYLLEKMNATVSKYLRCQL